MRKEDHRASTGPLGLDVKGPLDIKVISRLDVLQGGNEKAAYFSTKGGTAVAKVSEIEDKFRSLREFLLTPKSST